MTRSRKDAISVFIAVLTLFVGLPAATARASLVTLTWTAPGDDGLVGRATRYDLRYSRTPITAANFGVATQIKGVQAPALPGTVERFSVGGLQSGTAYYFAIKTADEVGNWSALSNVLLQQAPVTGVGDPIVELEFSNPWPNPARETMNFAYALPSAGPIQVDVFDVVGRHVRTIASGWQEAGRGQLSWDLHDVTGRSVQTGMYLMRARLGGKEWSRRLLVVR